MLRCCRFRPVFLAQACCRFRPVFAPSGLTWSDGIFGTHTTTAVVRDNATFPDLAVGQELATDRIASSARWDFQPSPPGHESLTIWVRGNVNHRQSRKGSLMAESRDMRKQIEHLVERSQREIVEASRNLSSGISKGTDRLVTPISNDIERIVDDVFDFAERVVNSQRRMVSDVVKAINEQADRAVDVGRTATRRITKRAPAKKVAAKRAPAKKVAAGS